ncbi:MAG: hypothetical protein O9318_11535 [Hylemonella sp.]|uniref:hypothetical protein n=1 Tax=Hylemonella sp. TaxID=2066020 RepID=UPI0022C38792|nr:hypothetical protein [Hylemonella sp.]MCZ8253093.1 hypothetical protein [Hylemonella sp.]
MDRQKCATLKKELAKLPEPPIVDINRFFDGNDDEGSIGCNLEPHPGIDAFRDSLVGLSKRQGIRGVYTVISELDPGEDSWPFSDTVLVVGDVLAEEIRAALESLQPDDVSSAELSSLGLPEFSSASGQAVVVWWD